MASLTLHAQSTHSSARTCAVHPDAGDAFLEGRTIRGACKALLLGLCGDGSVAGGIVACCSWNTVSSFPIRGKMNHCKHLPGMKTVVLKHQAVSTFVMVTQAASVTHCRLGGGCGVQGKQKSTGMSTFVTRCNRAHSMRQTHTRCGIY